MLEFPPELPISAAVDEIRTAIEAHRVVIVAGETGSGKTTQLPKICLAMGKTAIGVTQPRRIAATSVAARVARELGTELGEVVGYKVRFSDRVSRSSKIKFMTDGILLAEIQSDRDLRQYDTIIVDEAHERSLNIDFLVGYLRRLLPHRPDLRVIVSSATLEIERFAQFFDGAPVISVSGRTYPVDVIYRPARDDEDLEDAVANTVDELTELDPRPDVLVFLPGEREIRDAARELEQRALPHTVIMPLYARLTAQEQERVFQPIAQRRVVLATNVAETSLTIPGIVYVVDSGLARINRYDPRTGVSKLLVEDVSRASADQRKGRCGRTQSGVCFRLYEEQDYLSRPAHTDPEIKRVNLAGVILRMKTLRLGEIEQFPFVDPAQPRAISEGYRVLEELGAIDERGDLTEIGEQLGRLPLDPRLGRMILGGREEGAIREVVIIAAALGLQDPRERPQAAQQQADEAHRKFRVEGSDFAGYLELWRAWREARERCSRSQLHRFCRDNFLSYRRMREWEDIHEQIVRVMRELDIAPNRTPATSEQLHRALLPGLLSKIGMWNQEARNYVGARQTRFVIHPSSVLAKKPPGWVMAAELVETSQLFARTCAKLDPAWVERAGGALCRRSHGDPHWEQKRGEAVAHEQVTLYGLPIVKQRPIAYARIDPAASRELFITHALVRHEYATKGAFMANNQALVARAHQLRDRARKSDMFADEYQLYDFFDRRLPKSVVDGKSFEAWRKDADPHVLELALADVLLDEAHDLSLERFPDQLFGFRLAYKFEPSEDDDGITITVPLARLPQLDPDVMSWTIPGWHAAKLDALLESLPKAVRKPLGPLDELVPVLAGALVPFSGPLVPALEQAVLAATGERIPRTAWDLRMLPPYLSFTYRVVDEHEKVLAQGKDLAELQRTLGSRARAVWAAAGTSKERFERTNLRGWDFDTLPESVTIDLGGRKVPAYPALVETPNGVDLRLLESAAAASAATRDGLRRLLLLQMGTSVTKLSTGGVSREVVLRAADEAFRLAEPPRDKAGFTARLAEGRTELPRAIADLAQLARDIDTEVTTVKRLLKPLVGKPGVAKAVVDDVESQLAHLVPPELIRTTPRGRLAHVPRYLRALVVRLQRQAVDPPKDQQKSTQVVPLWKTWQTRRDELRARGRAEVDEFGWLLEELRVQIFAPELKTAVAVSPQRAQDVWATLSR